jgi:hypothetical protein
MDQAEEDNGPSRALRSRVFASPGFSGGDRKGRMRVVLTGRPEGFLGMRSLKSRAVPRLRSRKPQSRSLNSPRAVGWIVFGTLGITANTFTRSTTGEIPPGRFRLK